MKVVTGDLCWVASLLLQLHTTPTLSSSSSQLVIFFPHKSSSSRSEKVQSAYRPNLKFQLVFAKKKEPRESFAVLRTVRFNRGLHGSMLFLHKEVFKAKRTTKNRGSRLTELDRMVRSGFQNHDGHTIFLCEKC